MVKRGILLTILLVFAVVNGSWAAYTLVGRIGSPDGTYTDLAIAGNSSLYPVAFPHDTEFTLGTDNPAQKWPYILPGPLDAWAGSKSHTHSIIFNLASVPAAGCMLQLYLIDTHASAPPTLRITAGSLVQETALKPGASDASLTDPHAGKPQSFMVFIPASYLHTGSNTIQLTSISGSWLIYDCITLWGCSTQPPLIQGITISPTILFKNRPDGLKQILSADFSLLMGPSSITAQVRSDAGWSTQQVFDNISLGSPSLELEIPRVQSPQAVHVTLTTGGTSAQADGTATPQKQWKIYLLPSAHYDNGYTAPQPDCLELHRGNTERAIDWCSRYPDFAWDLESSILAEDYLNNGSRPNDFLNLARQGRIGIQGFYTSMLTGMCSSDELSRMMDYYDTLRNTYGIEAGCAMQTDVPSMVGTMPMVLLGHGIKYLSHAMNDPRAYRPDRTLFYWEAPDGSRVLTWNTIPYGKSEKIHGWGDTYDFRRVKDGVLSTVSDYANLNGYPYDAILLHGAFWDNAINHEPVASAPAQWNSTYAYPKIIASRGTEFFKYIEANYASQVPVFKGDGGVYWEDGAVSSAFETGEIRTTKEKLQAAEKLLALCPAPDQAWLNGILADAWKNVLLFDEHGWGANQSVSEPQSPATIQQWAIKKSYADTAAQVTDGLLEEAMGSFTSTLGCNEDSIVVFNPSGWARSGRVACTMPDGRDAEISVDYVPPFGYRIFPASRASSVYSNPVNGSTLENAYYLITFDTTTGAVKNIYDKQLRRELVDNSSYGVNEYLYANSGTNSFARESGYIDKNIVVERCSNPTFQKSTLPARQVMTISATAPMMNNFTSQVTLYNNEKRIDFVNYMTKQETYNKEGGYFAFPFALTNPNIKLEIPDGVIRPDIDQLSAACRDWYDVQHFLIASDSNAAITWTALDSPLVTLQDIHRGQSSQSLSLTNGNVFAYIFNNYWHTNYRAGQGGPMTFRFSITSSKKTTDVDAKQFGENVQSPLVAKRIQRLSPASTPYRSFITVSASNVVIQAVKPARFANGTIVRLREIGGRTTNTLLAINGIQFKKAYLCNLAEDNLGPLTNTAGVVSVRCPSLGLTTILLSRD